MKQALLIGCGNQRGERIVNGCMEAGYSVTNIGSGASAIPTVNNIKIKWEDLDLVQLHQLLSKINHKVDFIFFNQNASSLSHKDFTQQKKKLDTWSLIKSWTKSNWLSCQLRCFLIKTLETNLHDKTIIGWMLSSYIDVTKKGVDNHPDYSGYKFTNYLMMKNFSKKFKCFGINPDFEKSGNILALIKEICLGNKKCDGEMF